MIERWGSGDARGGWDTRGRARSLGSTLVSRGRLRGVRLGMERASEAGMDATKAITRLSAVQRSRTVRSMG